MKQVIFLVLLFFASNTFSQNTKAHNLFEKYEDKEGFTSVLISEYAFTLFADVMEGEEEEFEEAARMITGLRILTVDDSSKGASFLKELTSTFDLDSSAYKPLLTVKSDGEDVLFYVREQSNKITEFVLLVLSSDSPVMILIEGDNIDLKKLKNIADNTDIEYLDDLDKLEN